MKHVYFAINVRNINVRKQAINDKLQGRVATYLTCGGVANDQIKKGLLLSLSVKKFEIGEYLAKLQTKRYCCINLGVPDNNNVKVKNSPDILSMARNSCR